MRLTLPQTAVAIGLQFTALARIERLWRLCLKVMWKQSLRASNLVVRIRDRTGQSPLPEM
jgi:hypothetical protein